MKQAKQPVASQRYKIKFSLSIIILCITAYILCGLGMATSIWRIIKFGIHDLYDVATYPFLVAVCVFCITLVTCILARSYYTVKQGMLVTQFGFIKTEYKVKDIRALSLDCDAQKLLVTFMNGQYMTLTVNKEWNENLVRDIMKENSDIGYSFTLSETPDEKQD